MQWAVYTISIEPNYNPQLEKQVMGRTDRKGQRKDTFFFRLVYKGSHDDAIVLVQLIKHRFDERSQGNRTGLVQTWDGRALFAESGEPVA